MKSQVPQVEIRYHHLPRSPALTSYIEGQVALLHQAAPGLLRCSITVECPSKPSGHVRRVSVRLEAAVPGHTYIVGGRHREIEDSFSDPYDAIRTAFGALRRQLEGHERHGRADVR
jgi:hypothetical protein